MTIERQFDCQPEDIAHLIKQLIEQKLQLSLAIEDAKRNIKLDWVENGKNLTIDSAVEVNKLTRNLAQNLKYLVDLKSTEYEKQGSGYKFNAEGNQTVYRYPIQQKKEVEFNRNVIKELYKKLVSKADTISTQIDEAMLKDSVNYDSLYDLHDSTVDIVEKYLANKDK